MSSLRSALIALAFACAACPSATTTGQSSTNPDTTPSAGANGNPADADPLFDKAEQAYAQKDYAKAADGYRSLLLSFPLYPKAQLANQHLGVSLLELHQYRDAVTTLTPLYDRLPPEQKPAAAADLSRAAAGAGQWGESVRYLAEASKSAPPAEQAASNARLLELIDGQVPEIEVAKLAQELRPDSPAYAPVLFKLARIDFHLHNWDQLQTSLQTLQQNAPGNPFAADAQVMLDRVNKRSNVHANTVGVLLPLSGKYQRFGEDALAGIKLAFEGASNIRLVVRDTAGEADKAKKAVEELVLDEGAIALIGPILTTDAQAAATDADELGAPIVVLSRDEGITDRGPYVFRNMLTNSAQAKALVDYAMGVRGFKSFAVLYPNIPYGQELSNFFWNDVVAGGGSINGVESYDHDQTTFSPVVKKLVGRYFLEDRAEYQKGRHEINESTKDAFKNKKAMEKLRSGLEPVIDFEALFIPDQQRNVGLIAPALAVEDIVTNGCDQRDLERIAKTLGYDKPKDVKTVVLLGANGWDSPELVERGGKFVQCSVFVDGFYPQSSRKQTAEFVAQYRDANNKAPTILSAYGFDTGRMVRLVLEKEKPATRDAFRTSFGHLKDFPGATGTTHINERNEAVAPLFYMTIDRNGVKEIDVSAEKDNG